MDGMLRGNVSGNESDVRSVLSNMIHDNVVIPWYYSREEIEKNSPSRRDGIGLKKETRLRKLYCTFLRELGKNLKVPQIMIATAIVFCHRFFLCQSHAKNDKWTIAIACMFLAGKVEETPRALRDVIIVSYEMITKKNLAASQRKEVYEKQKEIVLSGEELVLSTLNFDLSVSHPYKPLVGAIKKYQPLIVACKKYTVEEAKVRFPQAAWSFVNDCLCWTTLCLQYKSLHIAAGAFFLAVEHVTVELQLSGENLYQEFDITPCQLEDIRGQMLEIYDIKHIPASQGSIVESSDPVYQPVSRDIASTNKCPTHKHSNSDNHEGSSKAIQNQSDDNGSGEAGSVITEQKGESNRETKDSMEIHPAHKSRPGFEGPKTDKMVAGDICNDALVSQSQYDLKLLRDKVKPKLEAKKLQGERKVNKDLMDEDDLIEKELEDMVLAVEDEKDKQKGISQTNHMGAEHGEILDGIHLAAGIKGEASHSEEREMVDDVSSTMPSRKRKWEAPSENQLGGGKWRHNNS